MCDLVCLIEARETLMTAIDVRPPLFNTWQAGRQGGRQAGRYILPLVGMFCRIFRRIFCCFSVVLTGFELQTKIMHHLL